MPPLNVAIVSRDPEARLAAAQAFDAAPASWTVSLYAEVPPDADVVVLGPDVNGEGIRFDSSTASSLVETILRSASGATGKVVVVSGAGRGVGCTTIALHLALEYAKTHENDPVSVMRARR